MCTKFPGKAPEFWAYQASILRPAKNFEGTAWAAYDQQYRREALARHDLNWSACNARLYNEVFTGRAKAILRCQHCLSEAHGSLACPANPDPMPLWQALPRMPPSDGQGRRPEICRNYNEGKCKLQKCKYAHICKECYYPHPWVACHTNQAAAHQWRSRSSRCPQRGTPYMVGFS